MKASIIIAIYKDIQALELILDALCHQNTQASYEIIVAEDGEDPNVKAFIESYPLSNLKHTTQKDEGWRKNSSLNNAINISTGELLIFLDGDCIPYHDFVENYLLSAQKHTVLAGRRVELGKNISLQLRSKQLRSKEIETSYLRSYFKLVKDQVRHYEEGIRFPKWLHHLRYHNKTSSILGCNFAVNRVDMLAINGFNEDYTCPSVGEDTDVEYRLRKYGCVIKSVRNLANVFHLYHATKYNTQNNEASKKIFLSIQKKGEIFCKNGLQKIDENYTR